MLFLIGRVYTQNYPCEVYKWFIKTGKNNKYQQETAIHFQDIRLFLQESFNTAEICNKLRAIATNWNSRM